MNQQLINELATKVDELWFNYQFSQIFDNIFLIIEIPLIIFSLIALYKINQVLKIYIENNKDFL